MGEYRGGGSEEILQGLELDWREMYIRPDSVTGPQ